MADDQIGQDRQARLYAILGDMLADVLDGPHLNRTEAVQVAMEKIEALLSQDEPAMAEVIESHNDVTEFKTIVRWQNQGDIGQPVIVLPREPFSHVGAKSLNALGDECGVLIADVETVDGRAIDYILIEPKIKPIYGQQPK